MNELQLIENESGNIAVQGTALYKFLELEPSHYLRWSNKHIVNNPFAIENTDFYLINSPQRRNDFVLSLDFAKKLSMQCRTPKGEDARNYFLKCEQIAKSKENELQQSLFKELANYRRLAEIRQIKIDLNKEVRNLKKEIPQPNNAPPLSKYFQTRLNLE